MNNSFKYISNFDFINSNNFQKNSKYKNPLNISFVTAIENYYIKLLINPYSCKSKLIMFLQHSQGFQR